MILNLMSCEWLNLTLSVISCTHLTLGENLPITIIHGDLSMATHGEIMHTQVIMGGGFGLLTLELWLYFNGLNLASNDTRSWCPLQSPNIWQRTMKYKTDTNNFIRNKVLNRTSYDSLSILHTFYKFLLWPNWAWI